jgi:ankyrin repeat protein
MSLYWGTYKPPIWNAVVNNDISLVEFLIKKSRKYNIEEAGYHYTSIDSTDYHTPLCAAVDAGNDEMVYILMQAGANVLPSYGNHYSMTPLQRAARRGLCDITSILLQNRNSMASDETWRLMNDQLNARFTPDHTHGGDTALHMALTSPIINDTERLHIVDTLLAYGADVNAENLEGENAMSIVSRKMEQVSRLLSKVAASSQMRDLQNIQDALLRTTHRT